MERISADYTWLLKTAFPAYLAGVVVLMLVGGAWLVVSERMPAALLMPIAVAALCRWVYKHWIVTLADEVLDGGESLVVRRGDLTEAIPLAKIEGVGYRRFAHPKRMTLCLQAPSGFGSEIAFIPRAPRLQLNPLQHNAVAVSLMRRINNRDETVSDA